MKHLIVNADDFGYSYGVNKGIIQAHSNGIVTSTSVMVGAIAAHEAANLNKYPDLSVGLHLVLTNPESAEPELQEQVAQFESIMGKKPSHVDVHKILHRSPKLDAVLQNYSNKTGTPIRQLGRAKFISTFYAPHADGEVSINTFKQALNEATDTYNEVMCHVGYCDDYLRNNSSYNVDRELELKTICDPELKAYIASKGFTLSNWQDIR